MTKARKDTTCMLCRLPIGEGKEYHYQRYAPWECDGRDGSWWTLKAHLYCYHFLIEDYLEDGYFDMPDPGDFQYYTVCDERKLSTEQMEAVVNQPAVACKQCQKVTFPRMRGVDDSPYCSSHCYNLYLGVGCAGYCARCEREKRPMRSISFVDSPQMPAASPNAACVDADKVL